MSYSVVGNNQRITHAAITVNERLSAVLGGVKVARDKAKLRAEQQRTRYGFNGRRADG